MPVHVALGGNLGGVTSGLLSLDGGQLAASTRLDVLVPVNGFKRCVDYGQNFGKAGFQSMYGCRASVAHIFALTSLCIPCSMGAWMAGSQAGACECSHRPAAL